MLNNKGQVLVLFVLLIPIFLIIILLVVDIGSLSYEKNKMKNICDLTLDYMDSESDINKVIDYVKKNDNNIEVNIDNNNLVFNKKVNGILSHIINIDSFDLEIDCRKE